ncbi:hypothetical protein NFI96_031564 [Prochilodus magdalenae]|nr:hypothetical protein NFI96_031564 [Prochilodus magdalenae]
MAPTNKPVGSPGNPEKFRGQDFEKLCQEFRIKKSMFIDKEFPPQRSSIGEGVVDADVLDSVEWKRPSELVGDPCLIVDGRSRFDFAQGDVGNCWFLAAIGAITFQKEIMDQVVPLDQSFGKDYPGVFHFRFCREGRWIDVVIDDTLPTTDGSLLFLNCKTQNEFWPALLEKAYAKVCGSYKAMDGGSMSKALEDFTGGASKMFSLDEAPKDLWETMDLASRSKALMCCGTPPGATPANTVLPNGIVEGHAYTVTGVAKVKTREKEVELVRIFNPWGDGEWNGDWSDKYALFKLWMSMENFCVCYSELDICSVSSEFLSQPSPAPSSPPFRR